MNKPFLLVGAIFAFIYSVSYAMGGFVLISLESILKALPAETTDASEILEYIGLFRGFGFFMLGVAAVDIVAGFRLLSARKGMATKGEAIFWAIYLYIGAQVIGGVFATLGVALKDFKQQGSYQPGSSLEQRIKEVEAQYQAGIITKEEYEEIRARIIQSVQ